MLSNIDQSNWREEPVPPSSPEQLQKRHQRRSELPRTMDTYADVHLMQASSEPTDATFRPWLSQAMQTEHLANDAQVLPKYWCPIQSPRIIGCPVLRTGCCFDHLRHKVYTSNAVPPPSSQPQTGRSSSSAQPSTSAMSTLTTDGLQTLLQTNGVEQALPDFPEAEPLASPLGVYVSFLAHSIVQATSCEPHVAYEAIQWTNEPGMGDLVVILPRLRIQGADPESIAEQLGAQMTGLLPLFGHPIADGIHQRIFLPADTLAKILLPYILDRGQGYGRVILAGHSDADTAKSKRPRVLVDFSSPNLGQEFDGRYLRSTICGAFIASMYEAMGWEVHRMNFLGDWGKHIGTLAMGWKRFGSEKELVADPPRHLLEIYTQADALLKAEQEDAKKVEAEKTSAVTNGDTPHVNGDVHPPSEGSPKVNDHQAHPENNGELAQEKEAFFKAMEDGDADSLALSQRLRDACIPAYASQYARLGVTFDSYSGESQVSREAIAEAESLLQEKGIYTDSDDAWIIDFKALGHKGLGTGIARFRNGTTSYLLRDIAAALERSRTHAFDRTEYVVTSRQDSHFLQLRKALELMGLGDLAAKLQHLNFGKVQGFAPAEGRAGLLLGDVLDECKGIMENFLAADPESTVDLVGLDADRLGALALMAQDLSGKRNTTFAFDAAKLASTEGWTGLTLLMWLRRLDARLQGVVVDGESLAGDIDYSTLAEEPYAEVLRLLAQFPGVVKSAFKNLESSAVAAYLYRLTDLMPDVWDGASGTMGESSKVDWASLAFFKCVQLVLANGMVILGLGFLRET